MNLQSFLKSIDKKFSHPRFLFSESPSFAFDPSKQQFSDSGILCYMKIMNFKNHEDFYLYVFERFDIVVLLSDFEFKNQDVPGVYVRFWGYRSKTHLLNFL